MSNSLTGCSANVGVGPLNAILVKDVTIYAVAIAGMHKEAK